MNRFAVLSGLTLTIALVTAEAALACSCAYISPERQLRRSDGAVVARLLEVRPLGPGRSGESSADPTDYVYRTGRVYKGSPRLKRGRRLVVRSARSGASCGLIDQVGRLTGLFLSRADGRWSSGTCGEVTPAQMRTLDDRPMVGAGSAGCS